MRNIDSWDGVFFFFIYIGFGIAIGFVTNSIAWGFLSFFGVIIFNSVMKSFFHNLIVLEKLKLEHKILGINK